MFVVYCGWTEDTLIKGVFVEPFSVLLPPGSSIPAMLLRARSSLRWSEGRSLFDASDALLKLSGLCLSAVIQ